MTIYRGLSGAKCRGVVNRVIRLLREYPAPANLIIHLGTNDIFKDTRKNIKEKVKENLEGIRRLLPNTTLIWSDILIRLAYADQKNKGAGKRNMRGINKYAHQVLRKKISGDNKVVVHSHIFQAGRTYYQGAKLFEWDSTHPNDWGLACIRKNWMDALAHFNSSPQSYDFPPGSVRLQHD